MINVRTNGRTCVCGYLKKTRILYSNKFFEIRTIGIGSGIGAGTPEISVGTGTDLAVFNGIGRRKICNRSIDQHSFFFNLIKFYF